MGRVCQKVYSLKMSVANNYRLKKLKLTLLLLIILILGLIFLTFLWFKNLSNSTDSTENFLPEILTDSNIALNKIHHTATKNEKKKWVLNAESAKFNSLKNEAMLKNLSVTFFLKNNEKVFLCADEGILNYKSNNMEIFGNVNLTKESYNIKTERIFYTHNSKKIVAKAPVKISGKNLNLNAQSMTFNMADNTTEFDGRVDAEFIGFF
mmetsp:Transcript_587/g.393  ORF Transcript_587/g.393 Transcript_587/m.393 type:complete len:208 (-) Transcript_587:2371-2994(-)